MTNMPVQLESRICLQTIMGFNTAKWKQCVGVVPGLSACITEHAHLQSSSFWELKSIKSDYGATMPMLN